MRLRNTTESLKDASLLRVLFYMRMFWQPFTNLIYFSIGRKNILSLLVEIHLWEGIKRRNKWNVHRWTKQIDKVIVTTQWIWVLTFTVWLSPPILANRTSIFTWTPSPTFFRTKASALVSSIRCGNTSWNRWMCRRETCVDNHFVIQ